MAENSGFFDAHLIDGVYDRVYLAESFARYFASFIGNGIFGGKSNELMVQQKSTADMSVRVLSGQGWINGYWYENDDELSLAIDVADGVLNRIDIIVLRWDNSERVIRLAVEKGTSATNPSAPIIQRSADFYELKLANVYVKAGATKITQADITDTRLNNEVCGFVHGVIDQFDTTAFGKQIDSFIENFEASSVAEMQAIFDRINSLIDADMATRLTLDVDNLETDVAGVKANIVNINGRVSALEEAFIESDKYPGCFYRIINGNTEWINPPLMPGVEYALTERWNGNNVYQKTIYAGALSNKTLMSIEINAEYNKVISVAGYAYDPNNMSYQFPIISNGLVPIAVISGVEGDGLVSYIIINVNEDLSAFSANITVKYTK